MTGIAPELMPLLSVAVAMLDEDGNLVEANAGFLRIAGMAAHEPHATPAARFFIQPDFPALMRMLPGVHGEIYAGWLTMGDYPGRTQSLRARVWREDAGLRVLAEHDIEDMERLSDTMLEINRNYASAQVELAQAHFRMKQLNAELEERVAVRTAALEQARVELEQASRGKDEFLAAISHELKTPLNHILGFAELLKEGQAGELNDEQKSMAQDIFEAGSKQLAIVNSLIALARLQAGKVCLQTETQKLAILLGEIAARHAARAQAAGLAFSVEAETGQDEMLLDREVVAQLLDHLLSNAFKFTPPGGRVHLAARFVARGEVAAPVRKVADEYLELAVSDNGCGIAPEILPRLFQPFVQGDGSLSRSHGGTGIGLTLVRLLAELHGGGSGVASNPGGGAKFLVWLPVDKQHR